MFRREMGSKRGSLPPEEGDLTCMGFLFKFAKIYRRKNIQIYGMSPWLALIVKHVTS